MPGGRRKAASTDWRPAFLKALGEEWTIKHAAAKVGVSRSTVYEEQAKNPDFAAAVADVRQDLVEELEREAIRRAVDGVVERGTYDKNGNLVGEFVIKKSDRMMEMLLRANAPGKYRENVSVQTTGAIDHRVAIGVSILGGASPGDIDPHSRRAAAAVLLQGGSTNGAGDPES